MRWVQLPQTGDVPGPRSSHAIAVIGGTSVYLFGGELQPRVPLPPQLFCYSMSDSGAWRQVPTTGACPGPRVAATMAAVGDRLYLFGGRTGVEMEAGALCDLHVLDTSSSSSGSDTEQLRWEAVSAPAGAPRPLPRSYHAMAALGTKLFVFGGCGPSGRLNDLWSFDTTTSRWQQLPSSPAVVPRGGASLVGDPDARRLVLLGGFDGAAELADCHIFDTASSAWTCPCCCSGGGGVGDGSSAGALAMPFGRSVLAAVLHGGCAPGGGGGATGDDAAAAGAATSCSHAGHVVVFGGEVGPSDKGHAGAGNFTAALHCFKPPAGPTGDPTNSDIQASPATPACWHALQDGSSACEGPGPRGWLASTAVGRPGALLLHGGLDAANERRGELWLLDMHHA